MVKLVKFRHNYHKGIFHYDVIDDYIVVLSKNTDISISSEILTNFSFSTEPDFNHKSRLYGSRQLHVQFGIDGKHRHLCLEFYNFPYARLSETLVGYMGRNVAKQKQPRERGLSSMAFHICGLCFR